MSLDASTFDTVESFNCLNYLKNESFMILATFNIDLNSTSVLELHMQVRTATAVIGITALSILLMAGLVPISSSGFAATYYSYNVGVDHCSSSNIHFTLPSGEYSPGAPLTAYISWNCGSPVKVVTPSGGMWTITNSMGIIVNSGTFNCPRTSDGGCGTTQNGGKGMEFLPAGTKAPTTPGAYVFSVSFYGQEDQSKVGVTSNFTVTPEFPAGLILGVLVPFAALFGYVKLRKPTAKF